MDRIFSKRRDGISICINILEVAKEDIKKTRIVLKAHLNSKQLRRYLPKLIDRGLIRMVDSGEKQPLYRTTRKGFDVIDSYRTLIGIIGKE